MGRKIIKGYAEGPGGWVTYSELPGWEAYIVAVRAAVVNGQPRVTALRVEPLPDADPEGLAGARLRAIPLAALAVHALAATHTAPAMGDLRAAMRRIAREQQVKHDPRAKSAVEQVAAVWQLAYDAGKPPPRAAVVDQLHMSPRTADRYIARARVAGLIPEKRKRP